MSIQESIFRAAKRVHHLTAESGRKYGLTPRQIDVILVLADEPGLNQVAITERCGIDRSTLAAVMRLLRRNGLVTSVRTEEDARAQNNYLTDKGKEAVKHARRVKTRVNRQIIDSVGSAKAALELSKSLARIG